MRPLEAHGDGRLVHWSARRIGALRLARARRRRNGSQSTRRGARHRMKFASDGSPGTNSLSSRGTAEDIGSRRDHLNYRANVDALKRAGATDLLAVSAVGSLREELAPGAFVAADQFIDRTRGRVEQLLRRRHRRACLDGRAGVPTADRAGGRGRGARWCQRHAASATYLAMEGPQFSTRAESRLYRSWGCDVIGMTAMPEAQVRARGRASLRADGDGHRL